VFNWRHWTLRLNWKTPAKGGGLNGHYTATVHTYLLLRNNHAFKSITKQFVGRNGRNCM
jgi:hypothetical protein